MKTRYTPVLLLFLSLLLSLTACKSAPQPDMEAETQAVATVLEKYVVANETQNMEMIREVWADEPDIVVIGTEGNERVMGWEAIEKAMEKQFRSFSDTYIAMTETEIRVNPGCNTAWFSSVINYNFTYRDEPVSYEGLRFTGVLTRNDQGQWRIVQSHISVPAKPRNQRPVMKHADQAEPVAGKVN